MKICFSGTHRTGKTSLAERIAVDNDLIMNYTRVSETFKNRTVKESESLQGMEGFYERILQQNLITEHINKNIKTSESFSVFDRSVIDVYAYSEYFLSKLLSQFQPEIQDLKAYSSHLFDLKKYFSEIDFTFIVQPGIPHVESNTSCSIDIQETLNTVFLNVMDNYIPKDKYFVIPREVVDFEQRVNICQGILEEKFELVATK